jgi:bacterioferritin-associated ferredoxin
MLCAFITDLIGVKVQCGECLCETKRMRLDEKVGMLHCFVAQQWQDVLLLYRRSDCRQCAV